MKIQNIIMRIMLPFIAFVLIVTIILSLVYPSNNLISIPMAIATGIGLVLVIVMFFIYKKLYTRIAKIEPYIYWILLIVFGSILFIVSLSRSEVSTNSNTDYIIVTYSAGEYADGKYLEPGSFYEGYFSYYTNNIRPMILMSWLFRISDFLHIARFNFLLGCSCLIVVTTAWSIGYLATKDDDKSLRIPSLLLFIGFLPLWCFTSAFYTDTMSMGLCSIALALIKMVITRKKKFIAIGLSLIAASLIVFSMFWKITAIIPVIACVIAFFSLENIKKYYKRLIPVLLLFVIIYALFWIIFEQYDIVKESKNTGDPIISWVAIGMNGNGSWVDSHEYVMELHSIKYTDEKVVFTQKYISDNIGLFWNTSHLKDKILYLFADGNMMASTYTPTYDDGTWIWQVYNPYGKYYWRACQYGFVYNMCLYIILLIGILISMINAYKGKSVDALTFSTYLSFFGIFIFLMVWEANSRQLYNQMPMLITGEIFSLKLMFNIIKKRL